MRLFLIAGEASGDRLGADLMRGLQAFRPDVAFSGIGGPMMAAEGLVSLFPMEELSVMGLTEIVRHIPHLLRRVKETVAAIDADALITIDSPGFCFRVAKAAKLANPSLRTIHYVAPSVWAWRPGRAAHMAAFIDHVLALLPFEPPYMRAAGMTCDFVGHPVVSEVQASAAEVAAFRAKLGVNAGQKLLTVLPGSRHSELDRMLPVFAEVLWELQVLGVCVVIPAAAGMADRIGAYFSALGLVVTVLDPDVASVTAGEVRKRACFAASDAALACSGTVSLELAAAGTPMVIAYRASALTGFLMQRMALIDTATLVNIVLGRKVVPEFLFGRCRVGAIVPVLRGLLIGEGVDAQKLAFVETMKALDTGEPTGLKAARSVLEVVG